MDTDRTPPARAGLLGVVAFLGVEAAARIVLVASDPSETSVQIALVAEWLALGLLVLSSRADSPSDLHPGRLRARHIALGVGGYLVSFLPIALLGWLLEAQGLPSLQSQQDVLAGYAPATLIGLTLTGPILEEGFYRRYLIERVARRAGRRWPALLASWLTFTGVHLAFVGFFPMLQIAVMSAFLVALYERERSVWPCVVFHGLNSALVYLVFPLA